MFRPVRKKKNEISLAEINEVLAQARRAVVAFNGDDGYPYAVFINYLYIEEENRIVFHSSKSGHKIDSLNKSDKVCLTACSGEIIKEEPWAPFVKSAVVFGRCKKITDENDKTACFIRFASKYYPDKELAKQEVAESGQFADMYMIEIEHLSGKIVQEK
ncbi:MAG: pyridoxamine 5'-phosphate oxidase family protein [Erysipelotrichaceae bacterium]